MKATGSLPKMLAADRGYRSKEEREPDPDLLEKVPKVATSTGLKNTPLWFLKSFYFGFVRMSGQES